MLSMCPSGWQLLQENWRRKVMLALWKSFSPRRRLVSSCDAAQVDAARGLAACADRCTVTESSSMLAT